MPGVCHYQASWEETYEWLAPVKTDPKSAHCKICVKSFRIDNSGLSQVKSHLKCHDGKKKVVAAEWKNQRVFQTGRNGVALEPKKALVLSDGDQVKKAEILQALHIVDKNLSFASAKSDSQRFQLMFPDSKIAQAYQQADTKVHYVIKYGIADHVKQGLIDDAATTPYSFLSDETTTSQVKKQYDAYLIYWSKKTDMVEHAYCGSLFVGHCAADDLVDHYREFIKQYGLDSNYLLHYGMDGPNVNISFENKMMTYLEEEKTSFLKLGSCSLHPVHNAFQDGVKKVYQGVVPLTENEKEKLAKNKDLVIKPKTFDIDDFFCDVHFFFKLSSARREDYASLEELTGVAAEYAKKHGETRWVSMKYVAVRCLEQWKNIEEYFLKFLPKQKNFKREIASTQRYARLKAAISDPVMPAYISFIIFNAQDFEMFLSPFQSKEPLIHHLHSSMVRLLYSLMRKFIKPTKLDNDDLSNNITINVRKEENLKSLKSLDVGCRAKVTFSQNIITSEQETEFRQKCLNFYQTCVEKLQLKLPLEVKFLKDVQFINPIKRSDPDATSAISNVALRITSTLENVLPEVFQVEPSTTKEQVVDKIRTQWHFFQNQDLKEEWYLKPSPDGSSSSGRKQDSYWEKANVECGIDAKLPPAPWSKCQRIDRFWGIIGGLVDDMGVRKYPQLVAFIKCVLSLSHGNSTPERGFSINKILLEGG